MSTSLLLAKISVVALLAGYLPLFLGVPRYRRAFGILLVAAIAALMLCSALALQTSANLGRFTSHVPLLAGAVIVVLIVIAAATWAAYRWPVWALPVMFAVMPIRIPLSGGGSSANLLLPLYLVIIAVLIAEVVIRDRLRPPPGKQRDPLRLSLAVLIALAGISVFWIGLGYGPKYLGADWREQSFLHWAIEFFAFYVPFGLVLHLTWRYVASAAALRRLLLTVIASGAVFAVIGAIQYPTHWIFFDRARLLGDYRAGKALRVNSLFYDPNMFSRMLIMVVILCVALMVAMPAWRRRLAGVAFLAAAVNLLTLSRSGWIALIVGLVVFGFAWLGRRRGLYVTGVAVVLLCVALGGLVVLRGVHVFSGKMFRTTWGFDHLVGGRFYLSEGALKMAENQPLRGMGLGGFQLAYPTKKYRSHHAYKKLTASHTTPFTMLAELGIPGFLVYVAILWTALTAAFRRRRGLLLTAAPARAGPSARASAGERAAEAAGGESASGSVAFALAGGGPAKLGAAASPDPDGGPSATTAEGAEPPEQAAPAPTSTDDARALYLVRAGLGSVVVALVVHSLMYNAFFEDPYIWALFGMIVAAAYKLMSWRGDDDAS